MKKRIIKLDTLPQLTKKTRVAAYARVSNGKDAMLHSLATQVSYYKKLIQDNNEWEFVGIYADEALSGTKDTRPEFQLLLLDCRAGKIDTIITKSISRFARNTLILLETVRELQALNVNVYFEEQNINSISGEGEMILTFLASFAQEESRSVSENMKWRIKKEFQEGKLWGGNPCLGYKLENKKLILVPEEAKIVRMIFDLYIKGIGADKIGQILDLKGVKPLNSIKWNRSAIMVILSNYNYTGDLHLQKTYRENHLTKRTKINTGELDAYIVSENHDAIISKELFYKAQAMRELQAGKVRPNSPRKAYPFLGIIRCGICGRAYKRRSTTSKDVWMCSLYTSKGKAACEAKGVPDNKVKEAANSILNRDVFDEDYFNLKVDLIEVLPENKLMFHMKDETYKEYTWVADSRKQSWTKEMREQARIHALKRKRGSNQNG